jgi:hypothetical protein
MHLLLGELARNMVGKRSPEEKMAMRKKMQADFAQHCHINYWIQFPTLHGQHQQLQYIFLSSTV